MDNYVSMYPALSGIEIGNGGVFCGKVETKIGNKSRGKGGKTVRYLLLWHTLPKGSQVPSRTHEH